MLISLDTETTGIDIAHGALPFLVTMCDDSGCIRFWEWPVNPLTRIPSIPSSDLEEIAELLDAADAVYLQNAKFDARALLAIGLQLPWDKVRDTLVMGHLLASNHRHTLDWMCIEYLGVDIGPFEEAVKKVTQEARDIAKREYPKWRIATENDPMMPSVKSSSKRDEDKPWKNDMWLPRAIAAKCGASEYNDDDWLKACSRYANADSEHTLFLGIEMERIIRQRGLWAIYQSRCELPRIACEMELYGVTAIGEYTDTTIAEYELYGAEVSAELTAIAAEYKHDLELADGASINDNMREFFYGSVRQACPHCGYTKRVKHWQDEIADNGDICPKCIGRKRGPMTHKLMTTKNANLALPIIYSNKKGKDGATLDKTAMDEYLMTTDGEAYNFIKLLVDKRRHDTDLTYMHAYRRFGVPVAGSPGYYRVHASFNPFATDHLRWASNSPNMQNVGQQEDECEDCDGKGCARCNHTGKSRLSVRYCFGPLPHREWWRMDYKQIERRIPPFECEEPKMLAVFQKPNEPPYWGSLYLLTASVLYPEEYWPRVDVDGLFRKEKPKLYKKAKFFDLAKQYGCGRRKGDLLSGVKNSFDLMDSEFPLFAALQQKYVTMAERTGWVETIPDRTVDPARGYPILASRTEDGRVLTTTPFNYHTSGTACWCKNKALIRCSAQLKQWRREDGFDAHIALEVHDEILFDFPRGSGLDTNAERAIVLRQLMEESGNDIGIPTPVSVSYHAETWAEESPIPDDGCTGPSLTEIG